MGCRSHASHSGSRPLPSRTSHGHGFVCRGTGSSVAASSAASLWSPKQLAPLPLRGPARHAQRVQHAQHAQHARGRGQQSHAPVAAAARSVPTPPAPDTSEGPPEPAVHHGDTAEGAPQVLAGKTVAVVGGGPGGMLCAAHLARLGAAVEVFESRDPAAVDPAVTPPPVWSIGLGPNAKKAIKAAGLSTDFGPKWRFEGAAEHYVGKQTAFFGEWVQKPQADKIELELVALATQPAIVAYLQAECGRVYGDSVRVHYGMRAVGGDVCAGEVVLQDAAGEQVARAFDMIIGADGVRSTVRRLMQQQDAELEVDVEASSVGIVVHRVSSPGHPSTFAALDTPSGQPFDGVPEGFEGPAGGCSFHFVYPAPDAPPAFGVCAVSVRHGGAEVVLNISTDKKVVSKMRSAEEVEAQLAAAYPQLPQLWLKETAQMIQDEALDAGLRLRSPTFVTCSKLASGRAVLLGDAAHAVSANVAVGCASALQDSQILSRACIAADGDVTAAAQRFDADRLADAQTLTKASKGLDAVMNYKFHGGLLAVAAGLPYYVARKVTWMSPTAPLAGILKANLNFDDILQSSDEFSGIRRGLRWYYVRFVALVLAAAAAAAAIVCSAIKLLPL